MQIQLRNPEAQNAPGGENDQMTIADLISKPDEKRRQKFARFGPGHIHGTFGTTEGGCKSAGSRLTIQDLAILQTS